MGTTNSTPTPGASSAGDKKGAPSKPARRPAPPPSTKPVHHGSTSSGSPFLKKDPKNYVDMGIEEEAGEQLEQHGSTTLAQGGLS